MKRILILFLGILFFGLSIEGASAETISYKKLDNIYFNLNVGGKISSNYVTMFYLDNRLAYCIEPGAAINTSMYNSSSNWAGTNFSKETQIYLEKVGYYGYEYTNHQTPRYYIATQELIWKAINNVDIYWTTGPNGSGDIIDVSNEKNEILSLIKKHDIVPSFVNKVIEGEANSTQILEDKNDVLNNYEISKSLYHKIIKQNNSLIVNYNSDNKEETISLTRMNNHYNDLLLVYTMPGSQALASLRISKPEVYSFSLKSVKKKEPEREIVRVPSTGNKDYVKHFEVLKIYNYDNKRFN